MSINAEMKAALKLALPELEQEAEQRECSGNDEDVEPVRRAAAAVRAALDNAAKETAASVEQSGAAESDFVWLVVQEGGTSDELFAATYDTYDNAEAFRWSCEQDGSYRTTVPVEVPRSMAGNPNFHGIAERLARDVVNIDYPSANV